MAAEDYRMNTETRIDPADPSRCRQISCRAGKFSVPRHVVRLESNNLAGWQVRWEGSKYFADGEEGDAESSLLKAITHLRRVWRPVQKVTARNKSKSGGIAGVRLLQEKRDGAWYVIASHPNGGSPKRFYVGNDRTWSDAKYRLMLRKAKSARKEMLAQIPIPIR